LGYCLVNEILCQISTPEADSLQPRQFVKAFLCVHFMFEKIELLHLLNNHPVSPEKLNRGLEKIRQRCPIT
jgi:hypothetical protein